ncbi:hypothetical protein [Ornithinimicrobium kibberense]|uniref:hypothetical protein n=1 Tax=Ornithinimicrobium kibberense TaxID=282060 RepID=UPI00361F45AC
MATTSSCSARSTASRSDPGRRTCTSSSPWATGTSPATGSPWAPTAGARSCAPCRPTAGRCPTRRPATSRRRRRSRRGPRSSSSSTPRPSPADGPSSGTPRPSPGRGQVRPTVRSRPARPCGAGPSWSCRRRRTPSSATPSVSCATSPCPSPGCRPWRRGSTRSTPAGSCAPGARSR